MNYIAKIRTTTVRSLALPVMADTLSAALSKANAACASMRNAEVDAQLLAIEAANGAVLLQANRDALQPGWSEVVWRVRFRTEDPEEAACLARISQADPESPHAAYEVRDHLGRVSVVDLHHTGVSH